MEQAYKDRNQARGPGESGGLAAPPVAAGWPSPPPFRATLRASPDTESWTSPGTFGFRSKFISTIENVTLWPIPGKSPVDAREIHEIRFRLRGETHQGLIKSFWASTPSDWHCRSPEDGGMFQRWPPDRNGSPALLVFAIHTGLTSVA